MLSRLDKGQKCVAGTRQVLREAKAGKLKKAFIAQDCDAKLFDTLTGELESSGVPYDVVPSMKQLGEACGIKREAAAAGITE
ncbi:MAG: L7Ae/L30e/S12e/Gadd45 family ribosomal protein [Christensenellales bacterium]